MKTLLLLFALVTGAFAFAGQKDDLCTQYGNLAMKDGANNVPMPFIAKVLNVAYELNFTQAQQDKLLTALTGVAENNPQGVENIGKSAYFGCTTDLSENDKALARKQFLVLIGE